MEGGESGENEVGTPTVSVPAVVVLRVLLRLFGTRFSAVASAVGTPVWKMQMMPN